MPRWHSKYKDPYFLPKNTFKPKPREYYASKTTYQVPDYLKKKLKEYLKKPQPRLNPKDYLIICYKNSSDPKEQQDLANFIWSIAPDRRKEEGADLRSGHRHEVPHHVPRQEGLRAGQQLPV